VAILKYLVREGLSQTKQNKEIIMTATNKLTLLSSDWNITDSDEWNMIFNELTYDLDTLQRKINAYKFIVASDSGLWNGRQTGYTVANSFLDVTVTDVTVDSLGIHFSNHHHDGVNYLHYRILNDRGLDYLNNYGHGFDELEKVYNSSYYSRKINPKATKYLF
jgi:hypothetical protein